MVYTVNLLLILIWNILCKPTTNKGKKCFLFLSFIQLFCLSTFRSYSVGYDSLNYYKIYISVSKMDLNTALKTSWIEPGYILLNKLAYWIGGEDYRILWAMCSLLVLIPSLYFIYRYSSNVFCSICVYICFGYYYASMNQIRQLISVSICLLGFITFVEKKYIKTVITIMIAISFHNSAIIFVALLCISVFAKYINRGTIFLSITAMVYIYLNFTEILRFVTRYYDKFNRYFVDASKSIHLTRNFSLYTLVYLPVLFIAFYVFFHEPNLFKENKVFSLQLWAIMLAEIILFLSLKMHILSRFALYFEIYTCTLLPNLYQSFAKGRYRKLLNAILAIALISINYYGLFIANNHGGKAGIVPYVLMKP